MPLYLGCLSYPYLTETLCFRGDQRINKFIIVENNLKININSILQNRDFELNLLNYIEAIKLDHRSYCEYYISLIKYNHPIIFSFIPFDDYNSYIIKYNIQKKSK